MTKIPKDIFFSKNMGRENKNNKSNISVKDNDAISIKKWLEVNNIKGITKYVEKKELDFVLLIDADNPGNDFTKPLSVNISSLLGKGVLFTGTFEEKESLVDSSLFGNPSGTPNDTILKFTSAIGNIDAGVFQGISTDTWWSTVKYEFLSMTSVATGDVLISKNYMETSYAIDTYAFDINNNPSSVHRYRSEDKNDLSNQIPFDELIEYSTTGVESSLGGRFGSGSSGSSVIKGHITTLDITSSPYTQTGEIKYAISCWNNNATQNDIIIEVYDITDYNIYTAIHTLEPDNSINTGSVSIPYTELTGDTWYMVKFYLKNFANFNSYGNTDISPIVTQAVFKTNAANDQIAMAVTLQSSWSFGSQSGLTTFNPYIYASVTSESGTSYATTIPYNYVYTAMGSYQGNSDTTIKNTVASIDAEPYSTLLNVQPYQNNDGIQKERVLKTALVYASINGVDGCPYFDEDILAESYFWYTLENINW
jgi:hypothetical protein